MTAYQAGDPLTVHGQTRLARRLVHARYTVAGVRLVERLAQHRREFGFGDLAVRWPRQVALTPVPTGFRWRAVWIPEDVVGTG